VAAGVLQVHCQFRKFVTGRGQTRELLAGLGCLLLVLEAATVQSRGTNPRRQAQADPAGAELTFGRSPPFGPFPE